MNVLVLHGSARVGGDTDTLVEHFVLGLDLQEADRIVHVRPIEMHIEHCRACLECEFGAGCIIDDEMQAVYPAFREADVVVMATPSFWGYMTSQLKTLFDRLEAICSNEAFGGKDFVLLVGYRHYTGSLAEWLGRITTGFGSRSHALLCRTFDPETGRDVPIAETPDRLQEAFDLGACVRTLRAG